MISIIGVEETNICAEIESLMLSSNITVMEAAIEISNRHGVEIEYIALQINNNSAMKAKLQIEGEQLHFLKKSKRLPI